MRNLSRTQIVVPHATIIPKVSFGYFTGLSRTTKSIRFKLDRGPVAASLSRALASKYFRKPGRVSTTVVEGIRHFPTQLQRRGIGDFEK